MTIYLMYVMYTEFTTFKKSDDNKNMVKMNVTYL